MCGMDVASSKEPRILHLWSAALLSKINRGIRMCQRRAVCRVDDENNTLWSASYILLPCYQQHQPATHFFNDSGIILQPHSYDRRSRQHRRAQQWKGHHHTTTWPSCFARRRSREAASRAKTRFTTQQSSSSINGGIIVTNRSGSRGRGGRALAVYEDEKAKNDVLARTINQVSPSKASRPSYGFGY